MDFPMEIVQANTNAMKIVNNNDECSSYLDWQPTTNTLFYLKNNGDIKDYSQYNHNMNGTDSYSFTELQSGRKVINLNTTAVTSDYFTESIGKTTFTMNVWVKQTSTSATSSGSICGWMGRAASMSTTDRRGAKWQNDNGRQNPFYIIYGPNNSSNWNQNTNGQITLSTSDFYLLTVTIDGGTVITYKNGTKVGQWTGSPAMKGGSNTGTTFYEGGSVPLQIGHCILEDKIWSQQEITDFFNKTKKYYGYS